MTPERLISVYPRAWRERYGEEFVALVRQTGLGPREVVDVVRVGLRERFLPGRSAGRAILGARLLALVAAAGAAVVAAWTSGLFADAIAGAMPLDRFRTLTWVYLLPGAIILRGMWAVVAVVWNRDSATIGRTELALWCVAIVATGTLMRLHGLSIDALSSNDGLTPSLSAVRLTMQLFLPLEFVALGSKYLADVQRRIRASQTGAGSGDDSGLPAPMVLR